MEPVRLFKYKYEVIKIIQNLRNTKNMGRFNLTGGNVSRSHTLTRAYFANCLIFFQSATLTKT